MRLTLDTPVSDLGIIGRRVFKDLKRMEIATARDLLFCFPIRHDDFRKIAPIGSLFADIPVTVRGKIESLRNRRSWKRRQTLTETIIRDDSGSIPVVWFGQPYLTRLLRVGDEIYLSGRATKTDYGFQFISPVYEKVGPGEPLHTASLVPIYPLTGKLTQKQIRWLVKTVIPLTPYLRDYLPREIQKKHSLLSLNDAVREIHFPKEPLAAENARRRLQFDEIFIILCHGAYLRQLFKTERAPKISFFEAETKNFVAGLPFTLTETQRKLAWTIIRDLGRASPMNRLLNGDVGSGKTVVAAIAALNAIKSGFQAALMAPTEILAVQHFATFSKWFAPFNITVGLLTGSQSQLTRQQAPRIKSYARDEATEEVRPANLRRAVSGGKIDFLIGTHALLGDKVNFARLGLLVIDEQHRFGVKQRQAAREKSTASPRLRGTSGVLSEPRGTGDGDKLMPHLLSMTATPIPRTLALTVYGDLDISVLNEAPFGRRPVTTKIVNPADRDNVFKFVRREFDAGCQVFIVCPLIDPSERLQFKAVRQTFEEFKKIFSGYTVGLLHGKLRPKEKNKVMDEFSRGEIKILVTTPVIEVGVNIPNATVMMIEGAERFGLAQLHQLRGRISRGERPGHCFAFLASEDAEASRRLESFAKSNNGFELAELDLRLRGPGDIYGTTQSGFPRLKMADLTNIKLIEEAQEATKDLFFRDPELKNQPLLRARLAQFDKEVHWE